MFKPYFSLFKQILVKFLHKTQDIIFLDIIIDYKNIEIAVKIANIHQVELGPKSGMPLDGSVPTMIAQGPYGESRESPYLLEKGRDDVQTNKSNSYIVYTKES